MTETFRPEVGGGETQAEMLSTGLVSLGARVTIVTRRSRAELPEREAAGGLEIRRLPPAGPGRDRKWGLTITAAIDLLRTIQDHDLVFVSGFRILGLPAVTLAHLGGKPCVLKADSLGEMSGEFFRSGLARINLRPTSSAIRQAIKLRNRVLRRADRFVAVSTAIRRELTAQGVDPGAIESISNGIDTERFAPADASEKAALRRALEIAPEAVVAVFAGRLVSYKGLPQLLRVWNDMCREHPDGLLLLVGEGGLDMHACEDELRRYVEDHGLRQRVRFTGAVTDVENYLKAADLFVFPTEDEAFGLALVEAMACGLPFVSTRVGGLVDIVDPEVDGLAIDVGDAGQLGHALDRLLRDVALRRRLGCAAIAKARTAFGARVVTARYAGLFDALAARR